MFKAIVCDIQGVLIGNGEVNHNLIEFLIQNKQAYGILILYTNLSKQSVQNLKGELSKFFDSVDKVYSYNDVEHPKPNVEGFEEILNEWNLKPKEVIFIDDSEINIKSAKSLGINTIHYKDFGDISTLESLLFP
jgi:HAD superfamily hydrolase (TIGR01509 family)